MKSIIKAGVSVLALILFTCTAANAQPSRGNGRPDGVQKHDRSEWYQKMKAQKVAFFTTEIGLTEDEAKEFWPIYDAAEKAQREASQKVMEAYRELLKAVREDVKDAEVEKLLGAYVSALEASKTVDPEVIEQYGKVLPAKKVAKIFIAEEKFRQQQIRQLHSQGNQRGDQAGNQHGGPRGFNGGAAPYHGQAREQ